MWVKGRPSQIEGSIYTLSYKDEELLTKNQLQKREIFAIDDPAQWNSEGREFNTTIAFVYGYERHQQEKGSFLLPRSQMHKDHWVHKMVTHVTNDTIEEMFDYRFNGKTSHSYFNTGLYVLCSTSFTESVTIICKRNGNSIDVTDYAFLLPDGDGVAVPTGEQSGEVVSQLSCYEDEYNHYLGNEHEEDERQFMNHILANRCKDPAVLLQTLLRQTESIYNLDLFTNKKLFVEFGNNSSEITVKAA